MPPIILASGSATRRDLLQRAGVPFTALPATFDEAAAKQACAAAGRTAEEAALILATGKAMQVSKLRADALVIGADQLLDCAGRWFDKPRSTEEAQAHLLALQGRSHRLATAVVCVRHGAAIWHHVETPLLTMRPLSASFIERYVTAEGDALLGSVGAYRIEGRGAQMFDRIEGDYFAVLGLPLIALLGLLRQVGGLES